jgi:DNA-3-methyladenine glycosylase I
MKRRGFKFVGPTIVYAWMQAVGIVNDHAQRCYRRHIRTTSSTEMRRQSHREVP